MKDCKESDATGEEDYEESEIDKVGYEKSEGREVLDRHVQTAPSQNEFESTYERGRPTRATQKPPRFRDNKFKTQFRPSEKKKRCNGLGRGDQARKKS